MKGARKLRKNRFHSFEETIIYTSAFFKGKETHFPKSCYENKNIIKKFKTQQPLMFKILMQSLSHRCEFSTVLGASR